MGSCGVRRAWKCNYLSAGKIADHEPSGVLLPCARCVLGRGQANSPAQPVPKGHRPSGRQTPFGSDLRDLLGLLRAKPPIDAFFGAQVVAPGQALHHDRLRHTPPSGVANGAAEFRRVVLNSALPRGGLLEGEGATDEIAETLSPSSRNRKPQFS